MENQTIAERIRARLEHLGKNPSAVALEAGLNRSAVQDILRGKALSPRLDTLQKLTGPLECSLEFLTGTSDIPGSSPQAWHKTALIDTYATSPGGVLEAGVFREDGYTESDGEESVVYRDPRQPTWEAALFAIGDESLAGIDIRKGDLATVIKPPLEEEISLKTGMVVAVRRQITQPKLHEQSARYVMVEGDVVHFMTRPSSSSPHTLMVRMEQEHPGDKMPVYSNTYFVDGGGTIEILGVVARISRSMSL